MHLVTIIISLFQMSGSTLMGNAWFDAFLDKMVGVEQWFYSFAWWIWAIVVLLAVIALVAKYIFKVDMFGIGLGLGCVSIVLLVWPLAEWVSLLLIKGMADNFNATDGIYNPVPFIVYALLYLLFGAG